MNSSLEPQIAIAERAASRYPSQALNQNALELAEKPDRKQLGRRERWLAATAGAALLGLLFVAAMLKPSPLHQGTHRQLGLPPCTFSALFGLPCPTCGMTTSWAHLVRGEWMRAMQSNAGGAVLGVLALAAAPWLLGSAWRGVWLGPSPNGTAAAWIANSVLLITFVHWGIRLWCR